MAHNQSVLNYLYMMEELAEKAQLEASEEDYLALVTPIRKLINDTCEGIEDQQYPEYHPDWSVLPLTDARIWSADQSHNWERLYEHKGRKFRVRIIRNAYDTQSSARIYGLDHATLKWNYIADVPFEHWPIKAKSSVYVRALNIEEQGAYANLANELTEIVRKLMFTPE
jgi:hypothetical protein